MKTVTSRRLLNQMEKAGHIAPVPEHCRPKKEKYYYVDTIPGKPTHFKFRDHVYLIEYRDGCFFPFVYKVTE